MVKRAFDRDRICHSGGLSHHHEKPRWNMKGKEMTTLTFDDIKRLLEIAGIDKIGWSPRSYRTIMARLKRLDPGATDKSANRTAINRRSQAS